jgi:hypothetical protein
MEFPTRASCTQRPSGGYVAIAAHELSVSAEIAPVFASADVASPAPFENISGMSVASFQGRPLSKQTRGGKQTMTPGQNRPTDEVLRRVQGEFLEMPGLRLTGAQARRLWGLDAAECDALLGALVDAKFLFKTRDGAFMRVEHAAARQGLAPIVLRRSRLTRPPL